MKNKDGIELKVGQIWRSSLNNPREIKIIGQVGFDDERGTQPVCHEKGIEFAAYNPKHLVELLKSHDGADLEQARKDGWLIYVDGMEKPNANDIAYAECYVDSWETERQPTHTWKACCRRYKLKQVESEQIEVLISWTYGEPFYARPANDIYRRIGYKYAESDVVSCIGPNAWWDEKYSRSCTVDDFCDIDLFPIFATHAIYQKVRKGDDHLSREVPPCK